MKRPVGAFISSACALAIVANSIVGIDGIAQDKKQEKPSVGVPAPLVPAVAMPMPMPMPPKGGFYLNAMSPGNGVVKDAPFSGEMVFESVQPLVDGNRIVNRSSTTIYRDGQGRTRHEQSFKIPSPYGAEGKEHKSIHVVDPVDGNRFTLDPQSRTGHKSAFFGNLNSLVSKEDVPVNQGNSSASAGQRGAGIGARPVPPEAAKAAALEASKQKVNAVAELSLFRSPNVSATPFVRAGVAPMDWAVGPGSRSEPLGKQMIEGVEAEGTRTIQTIPAGAIGNEREIEIAHERWYSHELKMDVLTRTVDPRWGESTQRLININRSEPDPSLFQIPSDYKVEELGGPRREEIEMKLRGEKRKTDQQ